MEVFQPSKVHCTPLGVASETLDGRSWSCTLLSRTNKGKVSVSITGTEKHMCDQQITTENGVRNVPGKFATLQHLREHERSFHRGILLRCPRQEYKHEGLFTFYLAGPAERMIGRRQCHVATRGKCFLPGFTTCESLVDAQIAFDNKPQYVLAPCPSIQCWDANNSVQAVYTTYLPLAIFAVCLPIVFGVKPRNKRLQSRAMA